MTRPRTFWLVLAAVAVLAYVILNAVWWWSIGATARVIDAETKRPIPGAIVLANWELKGLEGWVLEQLAFHETRSAMDGSFSLPGWGPRLRWYGEVRSDQPIVRVLHPNYLPAVIRNRPGGAMNKLLHRFIPHPSIDGQTIDLQPFRGPLAEYASELRWFQMSIEFLYGGGNCEWQHAPATVLEMDRIKNELQGSGDASRLLSLADIADSPKCRSAREFFRGYVYESTD